MQTLLPSSRSLNPYLISLPLSIRYTLEQYCARMENLYTCLLNNGAQVQEFQVMADLINGLPEEMDPIKLSLHGALGGKRIGKALNSIRGAAYGLQTSNERVRRFGGMAANRVPSPGPSAYPGPGTSGRQVITPRQEVSLQRLSGPQGPILQEMPPTRTPAP